MKILKMLVISFILLSCKSEEDNKNNIIRKWDKMVCVRVI